MSEGSLGFLTQSVMRTTKITLMSLSLARPVGLRFITSSSQCDPHLREEFST